MPFLSVNNSTVHYEMDGPAAGPVLVFSNSLGTDLNMWKPEVPVLSQEYRVLRYDTRGHGQSSVSRGPYSVEQLAGDVLALLDALTIDKVRFCGLSLGGMIGMALALRVPQRVEKLVLCNTAAKIGTAESWTSRIAAVEKGGMSAITEAVLERWYTPGFRQRAPQAVAETRDMLLRTPAEGYVACCAAVRDMDQREAIRQIRIPTLLVAGSHDPVTTPADVQAVAAAIQGARFVELPAAHLSNIEAAAQFTESVHSFLRG